MIENILNQKYNQSPYPLLRPPQMPVDKGFFACFRWLVSLNEEERIRVGIHTGEEQSEVLAASALRIPPPENISNCNEFK